MYCINIHRSVITFSSKRWFSGITLGMDGYKLSFSAWGQSVQIPVRAPNPQLGGSDAQCRSGQIRRRAYFRQHRRDPWTMEMRKTRAVIESAPPQNDQIYNSKLLPKAGFCNFLLYLFRNASSAASHSRNVSWKELLFILLYLVCMERESCTSMVQTKIYCLPSFRLLYVQIVHFVSFSSWS